MTHKLTAVHGNRHGAASCVGQATAHTFQTYALAAGIGAIIGLVLVTMILIAWRVVIRTPTGGKRCQSAGPPGPRPRAPSRAVTAARTTAGLP